MEEIWKDIPGYEGLYQASNMGQVKSLDRIIERGKGTMHIKNKILKPGLMKTGYLSVVLCKDKKTRTFPVHILVAMTFLEHIPCGFKIVVDHIVENDKLNNRLDNLQLITNRENVSKDKKGGTSKHIGVHWNIKLNKWVSEIRINGKRKYLGGFDNELEAAKAYQQALKIYSSSF